MEIGPISHAGFAAGFMFAAVILLLILCTTAIRWPFKAILIVMSLPAAYGVGLAWRQTMGWPSDDAIPDGARFISGYVIADGAAEPKVAVLWVIPDGSTEPRALRTPYTRALGAALAEAKEATRLGVPLRMGKIGAEGGREIPGEAGLRFEVDRPPEK